MAVPSTVLLRGIFVALCLGGGFSAHEAVELRPHEEVEPWWKQETIEYGVAQKDNLPWEDAFEGLGQFEFLQQYAEVMEEPGEPVPADNTQRVAPKRLECSCSFTKVNTQAEPKSAYHVGTLESSAGSKALSAQSAPATNFVEERNAAAAAAAATTAPSKPEGSELRSGTASRFVERFSRGHRTRSRDRDGDDGWVDRPYPMDERRDHAGRDRDSEFIEERDRDDDGEFRRGMPRRRSSLRFRSRRTRDVDRDEDDRERSYHTRDRRFRPYDRYAVEEEERDRGVLMEMRQRYPAPARDRRDASYDTDDEAYPSRLERRPHRRRYEDDEDDRDYERRDPYEHVSRWEEGEFRPHEGYEPVRRRRHRY